MTDLERALDLVETFTVRDELLLAIAQALVEAREDGRRQEREKWVAARWNQQSSMDL